MKAFALGVTITSISLILFALTVEYAHVWWPYVFFSGLVWLFCLVSYKVGAFFLYEFRDCPSEADTAETEQRRNVMATLDAEYETYLAQRNQERLHFKELVRDRPTWKPAKET